MKIKVDTLTDAEVMEIQDHQWDSSEFEGDDSPWAKAMIELCENMRSMPVSSYRNYLKKCDAQWDIANA